MNVEETKVSSTGHGSRSPLAQYAREHLVFDSQNRVWNVAGYSSRTRAEELVSGGFIVSLDP